MVTVSPNERVAPSDDRVGQIISGRYRIDSLLGEGGMGAVYLAEHMHMRKRFALKLLHPQMAENAEVLARFRREAEAAAHVEHPNIVAATDFGQTEDGAFFLVLEYVDGTTLRDALARGPFPAVRALHVARQIAFALERAHEAGIVHRDLKPENVMLVARPEDPDFVKVLDFGVARFEPPSGATAQILTQVGTVMGTPSYMAPEQAVGDRVTHRADLYALGCVLYEMLTGRLPFTGDLLELLTKHITEPVPPMAERAPGVPVPAPIEAVVRKLLEKEASNRHPTARALVEAIDQAALESGLDTSGDRTPGALVTSTPLGIVVHAPARSDAVLANTVHVTARSGKLDVQSILRQLEIWRARAAVTIAPAVARADVLLEQTARRVNLPKNIFAALLAGGVGIVLVLFIVVVAASGSRRGETSDVAKLVRGRTASGEEIRAAAIKGPAALEELATAYPKDPAVARELAFAYDAAGRGFDALRVVRLMAEADAKNVPRELLRVVIRATSKLETADEAFRLLEGPLGQEGVDALVELGESKDVPSATAGRAQRSLTKTSVRANASPAAGFFIDLTNASTCEERHDVLVRSGNLADARARAPLHALESKQGCGRRKREDCNPCLRKDDALSKAIDAARER